MSNAMMDDKTRAQLTAVFDEVFKFKIGDLVAFAVMGARGRLEIETMEEVGRFERLGSYPAMMVSARQLEQCHGGVQKHCAVTDVSGSEATVRMMWVPEFELMAYDEAADLIRHRAALRKK